MYNFFIFFGGGGYDVKTSTPQGGTVSSKIDRHLFIYLATFGEEEK